MITNDLAYAAGIMDGEGYIGITMPYPDRPIHRLQLSVSMTHKEVPLWFKDMFKGHVGCYRNGVKNTYRHIYMWVITGRPAAQVLALIKPYVKIKNRQCEIGIEFGATIRDRNKSVSNETYLLRHNLMNEIRQENQGKYSPHHREAPVMKDGQT